MVELIESSIKVSRMTSIPPLPRLHLPRDSLRLTKHLHLHIDFHTSPPPGTSHRPTM